jgi:hypothetical protein
MRLSTYLHGIALDRCSILWPGKIIEQHKIIKQQLTQGARLKNGLPLKVLHGG